ncbi:aspartate carbamoyltransferase 2, chloroplastic-like protein [Tanacetum coccineum]|uniref:aspartate carbamoyltransferase n=1 Tax=Tanacetum coccineum TaxID=301880 RepID=A0ABQ4YF09_9ASTR
MICNRLVIYLLEEMSSSMFSATAPHGTALGFEQSKVFGDFSKSDVVRKSLLHFKRDHVSAKLTNARVLSKDRIEHSTTKVESNLKFLKGEKFQLDDVIEAQQFDRDILSAIFEVAREMETIEKNSRGSQLLNGFLMSTLFYEPSTRTRLSFESAMKRLGGEVLTTENAREFSSAAKGETLEDTIRTVEGYSDIIVMRHFEGGAARRAALTANIPVINAGDGPGQHPTQALLDVYTIKKELGKLDGIKVGLVGDLANGRTVRSLAYLLAKYNNVKIYFVSPEVVRMKEDIKEYLTLKGVDWEESSDLKAVASKCDVVYQTRIQKERFGERTDLYDAARGKYIIDRGVLDVMQKHAVVMHPLPRLDEITVDVDDDPRAAYFRQAKNGLYIRMALLKLLLLVCVFEILKQVDKTRNAHVRQHAINIPALHSGSDLLKLCMKNLI